MLKGIKSMDHEHFVWNERLGIHTPLLNYPWDTLDIETQSLILSHWEGIRGRIPERIKQLERIIVAKQEALYNEDDFTQSCQLNSEIAEHASMIVDLHLWYRTQQDLDVKMHH